VAGSDGRILRRLPVPAGPGRAVVQRSLAQGVGVTVWDVDDPRELQGEDDVGDEPGTTASRLVLHGDSAVVTRLLGELREAWAGRLRVLPIRPGFIGVFAPQVDKGDALRFVAGRLGVTAGRTVACGDGAADETLLAAAALRVAVGEEPHVLGGIPDVIVADWAHLPGVLRARVLPLL
jgi:hydroxymethylpyrimidine pyrophosphatase-like HAD family hydrolase